MALVTLRQVEIDSAEPHANGQSAFRVDYQMAGRDYHHSAYLKVRAHFHLGKEVLTLSRVSCSYKAGTDNWPQNPRVGGRILGRQLW